MTNKHNQGTYCLSSMTAAPGVFQFYRSTSKESFMNKSLSLLAASLFLAAGSVFAGGDQGAKSEAAAASTAEMVDGEVRKVDMDTKKITVKHGEMKNLQMPGMTMVFQVKDPAMLDKVKAGDKVKFQAEKVGGAFTVMSIEPAQ